MTYEETDAARVTPQQALYELRQHGVSANIADGAIIASDDMVGADGRQHSEPHRFAIGADGCVSARIILNWLGY